MSDRLIVAAVCRHSCITGWETWLTDRVKSDTKAHYIAHIRTLVPKRKYLAAAQSFATYLVRISVLPSNVARGVDGPPQNKPRAVEIPLADVRRIVDGADGPYRGLFALLYGTGIEISAALTCIETAFDTQRREVRARGTKAHTRDRVIRVAEWAWPYVEAPLETVMPGERLFRGLDRKTAGDAPRPTRGLRIPRCANGGHAVRAVRATQRRAGPLGENRCATGRAGADRV